MNIGKFVKHNTKVNKRVAKDMAKQERSISFLQNARGISKQSSFSKVFKPKGDKSQNISISFNDNIIADANFDLTNRLTPNFDNTNDYPLTRNKTKVLNFENMKFTREESDPTFRPNVFNESNSFNTADHYFGYSNPYFKMNNRRNTSKISNQFDPVRRYDYSIPPLKTENLRQISNACSRNSSIPLIAKDISIVKSSETASFGIQTRKNSRYVSQPMAIK